MLDVAAVDLASLSEALEDHSYETSWWLDPETGEVQPRFESSDDEERDSNERDLIVIEPLMPGEAYGDLEDFVARIRSPRPRDLLERAIVGRGAFRRFKDTLFEFPELREAWFRFHDARMERRAIEWLRDRGLIAANAAERALAELADPALPELSGAFDPDSIARSVAADLGALYGSRLRRVVLFGSWARGDATPESDVDLLVVLDEVLSPWEELRRMDSVLWRHSFDLDTVITAVPVGERELLAPRSPALSRAQVEGRTVA